MLQLQVCHPGSHLSHFSCQVPTDFLPYQQLQALLPRSQNDSSTSRPLILLHQERPFLLELLEKRRKALFSQRVSQHVTWPSVAPSGLCAHPWSHHYNWGMEYPDWLISIRTHPWIKDGINFQQTTWLRMGDEWFPVGRLGFLFQKEGESC